MDIAFFYINKLTDLPLRLQRGLLGLVESSDKKLQIKQEKIMRSLFDDELRWISGGTDSGEIIVVGDPPEDYDPFPDEPWDPWAEDPGAIDIPPFGGPGGGVNNPNPPPVPDKPDRELSDCKIAFLKGQLAADGMPSDFLDRISIRSDLDADANHWTKMAWDNGNVGAVTQGNIIYIRPDQFETYANFDTKVIYEEIYHAAQFDRLGMDAFYAAYGMSSVSAWLGGGDSYNDNLFEVNAKAFADKMGAINHHCG